MKNLTWLKTSTIILSVALLTNCAENKPSEPVYGTKIEPQQVVQRTEQNEPVVELAPVNSGKWDNPILEELEAEIREARANRRTAILEGLGDDAMEFSNPKIAFKENGLREVSIDVLYKGETTTFKFKSPSGHGRDFMFEFVSGFEEPDVTMQGHCNDSAETCNSMIIQPAYYVGTTKYSHQFTGYNPDAVEEERVEPSAPPETEEDSADIDVETETEIENSDNNTNPPFEADIETESRTETPTEVEVSMTNAAPAVEDSAPSMGTTPSAADQGSATLISPSKNTPVILTSTSVPTLESPPTEDALPSGDFINPPAPEQNIDALMRNKEGESSAPTVKTLAPSMGAAPSLSQVGSLPTSEDAPTLSGAVNPPVQPTFPEEDIVPSGDFENPPAPEESPDDDRMSVGAGHMVLTQQDDGHPETLEEVHLGSAHTNPVGPLASISSNPLLQEIQEKEFNQSKGFYSRRGHITNATQLTTNLGDSVANSGRRHSQYGSGLLTKTLEFTTREFSRLHPGVPVCINDLSRDSGGRLSGHGSHQNGLDVDISFPSTGSDCQRSPFTNWRTLDGPDDSFRQKNWDLLKLLISTERVNILFVDRAFAEALCRHAKKPSTNTTKAERNKIFKKLKHWDGHTKHYHVRMTCNTQNEGCITQELPGNITSCD